MNERIMRNKQNRMTEAPNKRKCSHKRIESFDHFFQNLMSNRNNEYTRIQSPHLNERLSQISSVIPNRYASALSTPHKRSLIKHMERKKYIDIKQKIRRQIGEFQQKGLSKLKDVFEYKQMLLNQFLNEFTFEIQRQCKQKGQILKFIWNSMFSMIQYISEQLTKKMNKDAEQQLKQQVQNHRIYQALIDGYRTKQLTLNDKYQIEKRAMNKLVYELRFKRKEINKLYRNQKILLNKLNQAKQDNLNIQSSYIDLMSSLRDMPPQSVSQLLKAREEINKSKQIKYKIQGSRKKNKIQISNQMSNSEGTDQLDALFEEIKQISKEENNHHINTLIEAAIQNFGIKHDDMKQNQERLMKFVQKISKVDAQTQITENYFKNPSIEDEGVQFSYPQKLKADLIKNISTQTYCEYGKKKFFVDSSVEIEPEYFKKRYVKFRFTCSNVCDLKIWFGKKETQNVSYKINFNHFSHKKHNSEINNYRKIYKQFENKNYKIDQNDILEEEKIRQSMDSSIQKEKQVELNLRRSEKSKLKKGSKKSTALISGNNKMHTSSKSSDNLLNFKTQKQDSLRNLKSSKTQNKQAGINVPKSRFKVNNNTQIKVIQQQKMTPSNIQTTKHSSLVTKFNQIRQDFNRLHFLQNKNLFNLQINEQKQKDIKKFFSKKLCNLDVNMEEDESMQNKDLQKQVIAETLNHIDNMSIQSSNKKMTATSQSKSDIKKSSRHINYNDQNGLLMNLCRNTYYKNKKKIKERLSIFKYKDEFISVRDNIEMIAKDVKELLRQKENLLKKTINNKNIKNTYKILMMTFGKAYDCYNKGIVITNLVFPLFESFSLIYGAINVVEVYKKMINFIACLSANSDNVILKFFLFFLGLDSKSPYSEKVTISQVYLCLTLLEKISVDGKVTMNIQSIYTDTNKIKEELGDILMQENIPRQLQMNVKKRVDEQLLNSASFRDSNQNQVHLKLNIYSIILLVIQEVIKCKNALKESFLPIFFYCSEYKQFKKIPISLLEIILELWKQKSSEQQKIQKMVQTVKISSKYHCLSIEQFCSILFENNIISISQLLDYFNVYRGKWKIPGAFLDEMALKKRKKSFSNTLEIFEIELFQKLSVQNKEDRIQAFQSVQKMKKVIFIKSYQRKVDNLLRHVFGSDMFLLRAIQR